MAQAYYEEPLPSDQMRELLTISKQFTTFGSSIIASRKSTYIDAQNKQTGGPGQKTVFQLPRDGFLDPQTVSIEFQLNVKPDTGSGGSVNTWLQYGVSDIINRMQLNFMGGSDVENIESYNKIKAFLLQHNNTAQWWQTSGCILEGMLAVGDSFWVAQTPVANGGTGVLTQETWNHTPMLGVLFSDAYLPLMALPTMQIIIYWENFAPAFISTAAGGVTITYNTGTYSVSNLRLRYDVVYLKPEAQAAVLAQMASEGGWKMHYQTWLSTYSTGISTQNFNAQFSIRAGSIKSAFFLAAPTTWNSTQYDYLKSTIYLLTSAQFKVNNTLYPLEAMTSDQELYREFCKALGVYNTMYRGGLVYRKQTPTAAGPVSLFTLPIVTATTAQPLNQFIWTSLHLAGTVLAAYNWDLENDEGIISGLSTNITGTDIVVQIARGDATALDVLLASFVDAVITFKGTFDSANAQIDR